MYLDFGLLILVIGILIGSLSTLLVDLDRLGRDADDVISELKDLKSKGIRVIVLDIPYMNEFKKVQDSSIYDMIAQILIN